MVILDKDGNVLSPGSFDMSAGYLTEETVVVHHEAVEAMEEVSHYEVVEEFENGGKVLQKVIDTPAVRAVPAYDESTVVYRYTEYDGEDLQSGEPTLEDRVSALEGAFLDLMYYSEESESVG